MEKPEVDTHFYKVAFEQFGLQRFREKACWIDAFFHGFFSPKFQAPDLGIENGNLSSKMGTQKDLNDEQDGKETSVEW